MPCCQLVDDETVASDPQEFDCRTCEVMAQVISLDDDNRMAWERYRLLCNRFTNDLSAGGVVLDRLTKDDDADTFVESIERLRVIYDVLQPPKAP